MSVVWDSVYVSHASIKECCGGVCKPFSKVTCMAASYGKAAKAKATKLHSLYVRTRDAFRCRKCGALKADGKQIQAAHIISRSISSTRTDDRNAVALCASCHWQQSKNPLVWARWIECELGASFLDDLLERGVPGAKVDWEAECLRLQALLDSLKDID